MGHGGLSHQEPEAQRRADPAAYELLDFMLGGWYGAKITLMRGYMTNTDAPDYAKAHPDQFPAEAAEKVAAITENVHRKFAQGGTWQNRWPTARRRLRGGVGALQGRLSSRTPERTVLDASARALGIPRAASSALSLVVFVVLPLALTSWWW